MRYDLGMQKYGSELRACRMAKGLSQAELAHRAHTTQAIISRIERGLHSPTVDMLARLYAAMGLALEIVAVAPAVDKAHLEEELRLSMEERLARAFSWMRFNSQLQGAALLDAAMPGSPRQFAMRPGWTTERAIADDRGD